MNHLFLTALLVGCGLLTACSSLERHFSKSDYRIAPGDRLTIHYEDGHQADETVAPDGTIQVPGSHPLAVGGLTPREAHHQLQEQVAHYSNVVLQVGRLDLQPVSWRYPQPYRIGPLDRLTLRFADGKEITTTVTQEGNAEVPDVSSFYVRGLDPTQARERIAQKIPNLRSLEIQEFRPNRVTVIGEVYHQINTELTEAPMRVLDAIAAANGFTPLARTDRVKLIRQNADQIEVYELNLKAALRGRLLSHNLFLKPGDVITVPRSFL